MSGYQVHHDKILQYFQSINKEKLAINEQAYGKLRRAFDEIDLLEKCGNGRWYLSQDLYGLLNSSKTVASNSEFRSWFFKTLAGAQEFLDYGGSSAKPGLVGFDDFKASDEDEKPFLSKLAEQLIVDVRKPAAVRSVRARSHTCSSAANKPNRPYRSLTQYSAGSSSPRAPAVTRDGLLNSAPELLFKAYFFRFLTEANKSLVVDTHKKTLSEFKNKFDPKLSLTYEQTDEVIKLYAPVDALRDHAATMTNYPKKKVNLEKAADDLEKVCDTLMFSKRNGQALSTLTNSYDRIAAENKATLKICRGYRLVFINVAIALTVVGLLAMAGKAIHGACSGRSKVFGTATASFNLMKDAQAKGVEVAEALQK